jgi:hypothetical protein
MEKSEIQAIIKLVDDPDPKVFNDVSKIIIEKGNQFTPFLEESWVHNSNIEYQKRIQYLLEQIQIKEIANQIRNWKQNPERDLLDLFVIIERAVLLHDELPDIKQIVEQLNKDIWLDLNNNFTAIEKLKIVNHHIFVKHNFKSIDKISSNNLLFSNFLQKKEVFVFMLGLLYEYICEKNKIPVKLLNIPNLVLLGYFDEITATIAFATEDHHNIVCFVHPSQNGLIIGRNVVDEYLEKQSLKTKSKYFKTLSDIECAVIVINLHLEAMKDNAKTTMSRNTLYEIKKQLIDL